MRTQTYPPDRSSTGTLALMMSGTVGILDDYSTHTDTDRDDAPDDVMLDDDAPDDTDCDDRFDCDDTGDPIDDAMQCGIIGEGGLGCDDDDCAMLGEGGLGITGEGGLGCNLAMIGDGGIGCHDSFESIPRSAWYQFTEVPEA